MRLVSAKAEGIALDSAAWQARVNLAAAHRLADRQGLSERIFTWTGMPLAFIAN